MTNKLYYGDNIDILREHIVDESVDLIYLDPPFNSRATYNVLFKSQTGQHSEAQIAAFEDTWHWGEQAEKEYTEILNQPNTDVTEVMEALRSFLKENDMMAYLTMMTNRLLELHRVLKSTGSIYLHCDPNASHYLKIILDAVFGHKNFINEIVWKRSSSKNDTKQGAKIFGRTHDIILYYVKSSKASFNTVYEPYTPEYIESAYSKTDADGRRFKTTDLSAAKPGGNTTFEWKGCLPPQGRFWAYSKENFEKFENENRIYYSKSGKPYLKQYLDEMPGLSPNDIWVDIPGLTKKAERLGYPTQKPLALLERIIKTSSNENELVLDQFCGCGTAIHAAKKLNRHWIGIDITHLAITLIEKRLNDSFPKIEYEVFGTPKTIGGAKDLAKRDKYQFQWWASSLVNAQPYQGKKKGADSGIDGLIFFKDDSGKAKKIIISVKGGKNVSVAMIRDLGHVVQRDKAEIGIFITLVNPTRPMLTEATKAGFYDSPVGASFPRLQILTIEDLLSGNDQARYPDLTMGGTTFKNAQLDYGEDKQQELL